MRRQNLATEILVDFKPVGQLPAKLSLGFLREKILGLAGLGATKMKPVSVAFAIHVLNGRRIGDSGGAWFAFTLAAVADTGSDSRSNPPKWLP